MFVLAWASQEASLLQQQQLLGTTLVLFCIPGQDNIKGLESRARSVPSAMYPPALNFFVIA